MTDKDEITTLCRRLGQAHFEKDADAIAACYAPGAVIYSLAPPLGERGIDRDAVAAWLGTWEGPVRVETEDMAVTAAGGIGYVSALNRMRGTKSGGGAVDLWFRTTLCFSKTEEGWRIVHDHASVPFHMDGSYRAAVDLRPSAT